MNKKLYLTMFLFALTAFLLGQTSPECTVTPEQIVPQGSGSGLDSDLLDGLDSQEIMSAGQKTIFSWKQEVHGNGETQISFNIMTVPDDKIFILTDIFGSQCNGSAQVAYGDILEGETSKMFSFLGTATRSINLQSGIPFASGSQVTFVLNSDVWAGSFSSSCIGNFLLSGYLIDA